MHATESQRLTGNSMKTYFLLPLFYYLWGFSYLEKRHPLIYCHVYVQVIATTAGHVLWNQRRHQSPLQGRKTQFPVFKETLSQSSERTSQNCFMQGSPSRILSSMTFCTLGQILKSASQWRQNPFYSVGRGDKIRNSSLDCSQGYRSHPVALCFDWVTFLVYWTVDAHKPKRIFHFRR